MIEKVGLIITTKNRLSELKETLKICFDFGFTQEQFYIIDDASEDKTEEFIKNNYPKAWFKRYNISNGYIKNRNILLSLVTQEYILSLDDDSHIRSTDDIEEAIEILESNSQYGALTFKPFEQIQEPPSKDDLENELIEVKTYIGCGHLLKKELVDKLGSYREEFEFYGEELDYSIRSWMAGYKVVMKRDLVVHHRIDWEHRSKQLESDLAKGIYGAVNRSKLGFSNHLIIALLYYPYGLDLLFIIKYVMMRFYQFALLKKDWKGFYLGLKRFSQFIPYCLKHKNKMSIKLFFYWIKLPDFSK